MLLSYQIGTRAILRMYIVGWLMLLRGFLLKVFYHYNTWIMVNRPCAWWDPFNSQHFQTLDLKLKLLKMKLKQRVTRRNHCIPGKDQIILIKCWKVMYLLLLIISFSAVALGLLKGGYYNLTEKRMKLDAAYTAIAEPCTAATKASDRCKLCRYRGVRILNSSTDRMYISPPYIP